MNARYCEHSGEAGLNFFAITCCHLMVISTCFAVGVVLHRVGLETDLPCNLGGLGNLPFLFISQKF